jgi:phosphatidylserine/phosphatidylglycerophosphate/cardiolipin synthase-like enzyme
MRLHVRAIICDGTTAFVGSQSLRKAELDERREIGLIVKDARIAGKMRGVFEADWALVKRSKGDAPAEEDAEASAAAAAS